MALKRFEEVGRVMSKAFSNLLKFLGTLNPTQKEKAYLMGRYIIKFPKI
jgi:hypothetical protein